MLKSEELLKRYMDLKTTETIEEIRSALDGCFAAMFDAFDEINKGWDNAEKNEIPQKRRELEQEAQDALDAKFARYTVLRFILIGLTSRGNHVSPFNLEAREQYYNRVIKPILDQALNRLDAVAATIRACRKTVSAERRELSRLRGVLLSDVTLLLEGVNILRKWDATPFDIVLEDLKELCPAQVKPRIIRVFEVDKAFDRVLADFKKSLPETAKELLDAYAAYRLEIRIEGLCDAARTKLKTAHDDPEELRKALLDLSKYRTEEHAYVEEVAVALKGRIVEIRNEDTYQRACSLMDSGDANDLSVAARLFKDIRGWKDADALGARVQQVCNEDAYAKAKAALEENKPESARYALRLFEELGAWKDAENYAQKAREQIAAQKKKKFRGTATLIAIGVLMAAALIVFFEVINPGLIYRRAVKNADEGRFAEAVRDFNRIKDYGDARERYFDVIYPSGVELLDAGKTEEAHSAFYDAGLHRLAAGDLDGAYEAFTRAEDHADARQKACEARYLKGEKLLEEGDAEAAEAVFMELEGQEAAKALDVAGRLNELRYPKAVRLEEAGEYEAARALYLSLRYYGDSQPKYRDLSRRLAEEAEKRGDIRRAAGLYLVAIELKKADSLLRPFYEEGEKQLALGNRREALVAFKKARGYSDAVLRVAQLRGMISAGDRASFAITSDGRTLRCGLLDSLQLMKWNETEHTVVQGREFARIVWNFAAPNAIVLKQNGTIRGDLLKTQTSGWSMDFIKEQAYRGFKDIATNGRDIFAITTDLNVACSGTGASVVGDWKDIIEISALNSVVAGMRADGTAVCGNVGKSFPELRALAGEPIDVSTPDVSGWGDLIDVSVLDDQVAGLQADGTVVCTDRALQDQTRDWEDVIEITTTCSDIIGLRADGTVVATNAADNGMDLSAWSDIVAISGGYSHVLGLRADGTVLSTGSNDSEECETDGWKLW